MRYPVYIPSRGRPQSKTAALLRGAGIPFILVVEYQDAAVYARRWGSGSVLTLPESGRGIAFSRSWIKRHSERLGERRHWQLDDDVSRFARRDPVRSIEPADALRWAEDLADSYENVGLVGIASLQWPAEAAVLVNRFAYITILVRNDAAPSGRSIYWRPDCLDDADFNLQTLEAGLATLVIKAYRHQAANIDAGAAGGNTDTMYADGGRLRILEGLVRNWPGVVSLSTRKGRPAHRIRWGAFDPALRPAGSNPTAAESGLQL